MAQVLLAVAGATLQHTVADIVAQQSKKYNCSIAAAVYSESRRVQTAAAGGTVSLDPKASATTVDDIFVWGSITKVSTGAAILQLAQAGKLSLNDTIAMYVDPMLRAMKVADPSLNFSSCVDLWGSAVGGVTIYHLATMNSGIPDFDTANPFPPPTDALRATIYSKPSHDFTPPELLSVPWVATGKLLCTPGHCPGYGFNYSSTNFMLLGLILAERHGAAGWEQWDQSSFLPHDLKAALPSIRYVRRGAPSDVSRLTGYDRTSYNGHSPTALPGISVRHTHGVFAGWSASDYTSTVADAARLAYEVYGPAQRIIDPSIMVPKCDAPRHCICTRPPPRMLTVRLCAPWRVLSDRCVSHRRWVCDIQPDQPAGVADCQDGAGVRPYWCDLRL